MHLNGISVKVSTPFRLIIAFTASPSHINKIMASQGSKRFHIFNQGTPFSYALQQTKKTEVNSALGLVLEEF
jgi:hypothetical protein